MSNVISPNMGLTIPGIGTEYSPTWASDLNASLAVLDQHSHIPGSGIPIQPGAININSDLTFNSNNATNLRSTRLSPQTSPITSAAPDQGCLYSSGGELYYNDFASNQVKITQSGSVTGSSGTISGLPSGTASAAYSAGTFVFQSSTNTSAVLDAGSIILRNNIASSKGLTLSPPSAMSADYGLFLPSYPLPSVQSIMTLDSSGNMAAPYTVDGSTIAISSNVIGVPAGGITATQIANATITATQIANATITSGQIASSTILGSNLVNDINLPGTEVSAGSLNVLVSAPQNTTCWMTYRGLVAANGSISIPCDFTVTADGSGGYQVFFGTLFSATPIVLAQVFGQTGYVAVTTITTGTFILTTADTTNTATPLPFSFIAMGPR